MQLFRNIIHVEPNLPPLYKEGHEEWKGYDVTYHDVEKQVSGSYSRTNHPHFRSVHRALIPIIEDYLGGIKIIPTYFFDRVYYAGNELVPHTDQIACEVSITMQLQSTLSEPWTFFVEGEPINMNNGDAVLYDGIRCRHRREPMPGGPKDYHHQIFFHYVIEHGEIYNQMLEDGTLK